MKKTNSNHTPTARYRRGAVYVQEISVYIQSILDPEREFMLSRIQRVLVRTMRQQVTRRECECLDLYYVQGYNYEQISAQLRINISTISRNIRRGEEKINRVLDFAREILGQDAVA